MKRKKKEEDKFVPKNLRIEMASIGQGIYLYTCFAENSDLSMGSAWVRPDSDGLKRYYGTLLDIYVPQHSRRMGIATYIEKQLLEMYGMLRTVTGTKDGGKALLKAMKWKQNKVTGDWYLTGKVRKIK